MPMKYLKELDRAKTIPDLFEIVKNLVEKHLGRHRAGLMLGLTDLGLHQGGFVGAFFMVGGNAIVVNRQALNMVKLREPKLYKNYLFYLLLHEYLHATGILDESLTRKTVAKLCREVFGKEHTVTRIARDFSSVFKNVIMPAYGFVPPVDQTIELIPGFDRSSVTYIQ